MHHWQFFLAKYTRATLVSSSRLLHCNFKDLSASISSFSILEYSIKEMASLLMLISSSLAFSKEDVVYLPIKTLCRCCSGCCNMDVKNLDTVSLPFVPAICRIDKLSWDFPRAPTNGLFEVKFAFRLYHPSASYVICCRPNEQYYSISKSSGNWST